MIISKQLLLLGFIMQASFVLFSQEHLVPLQTNPTKKQFQETESPASAQKSFHTVVTLPFWDDFSYKGPYPDHRLWEDRMVFVNNSFAVHPKTFGVATFDALDEHGNFYEHITPTNTPQVADMLTSHLIRLDSVFAPSPAALSPTDGLVLSFYYQPQGRGGDPTPQDSLVLEFLQTPGYYTIEEGEVVFVDDVWKSVWRAEGQTLSAFSNDTFPYFKRVALPITDPVFFRSDFRFRFKGYVSFPLPGNPTLQNNTGTRTIWNIDYVFLDRGREPTQTNYFDIAFAEPAQPILARYTSMPWSHYIGNPQQHLRQNFALSITNLDNTIFPYSYLYRIQDEQGNVLRNYSGGSWNIPPFSTHGYQEYQPHARPIVINNPLPAAPAAERHFDIVHIIRAGIAGDSRQRNDTLTYRQVFSNYFACDDGIPEAGYGVIGRFPRTAKRFIAGKTDQLTAVNIFFNKTVGQNNADKPFKITIWKHLTPQEEILYQSEDVIRTDFAEGINNFITFELGRAVEVTDTFYVGIEQQGNVSINEFLSIGFDTNNNAGNQIFFNTGAEWMRSIYQGALMIRPVFGTLKNNDEYIPEERKTLATSIYPNPSSGDQVSIQLDLAPDEHLPARIDIFDMYGKLVYSGAYKPLLQTSHMANGVYMLRLVYRQGKAPETTPFIIAR